jgi:hypothetical protein
MEWSHLFAWGNRDQSVTFVPEDVASGHLGEKSRLLTCIYRFGGRGEEKW